MAVALNKSRMIESRFAVAVAILALICAQPLLAENNLPHEILEYVGILLIAICVIGRVYTSAFLGGFKNERLIDIGPFSVVRNPLYVFSLIGIAGIGFLTGYLTIMIGLPVFFVFLYKRLIRREEQFLLEKFGRPYHDYCQQVPKLWPNLRRYHAPETLSFSPRYLLFAAWDAFWWFLAIPVVEGIETLRSMGVIAPLFSLP